mmetsp:Transcript_21063/g.29534  ORF Transcript_21063/g.29534 Transcript_21063/m.29534 type:complete len:150 (-) Transcript_21063:1222-1671(-)
MLAEIFLVFLFVNIYYGVKDILAPKTPEDKTTPSSSSTTAEVWSVEQTLIPIKPKPIRSFQRQPLRVATSTSADNIKPSKMEQKEPEKIQTEEIVPNVRQRKKSTAINKEHLQEALNKAKGSEIRKSKEIPTKVMEPQPAPEPEAVNPS